MNRFNIYINIDTINIIAQYKITVQVHRSFSKIALENSDFIFI